MAKDNKEIEIKAPVSKETFFKIKRILQKEAKYVKTSAQRDTYFSPEERLFLKPKYPFEWLSVRERDSKTKLNYKHWYPEGKEKTDYCDEYEVVLDNQEQLNKILKALKFEKLVAVEKTRDIYLRDNLEIALDQVKGLGYFIEIESMDNNGGVNKTVKRIVSFAKSLGINKFTNIPGGYAAELMRRKGLMKET